MARIAGVSLPKNKPLFLSLQSIYGIGKKFSENICEATKIDRTKRTHELSEAEAISIRKLIDEHYVVEGDLRREVSLNRKRLIDLRCYRGLRHSSNLPCRGQRTSSNARTRRGRARAIPGKKG
jgi:small subunit ribosomal protein S13